MDIATDVMIALQNPQERPDSEMLSPQLSTKRKRDEAEYLPNGNQKANGTSASGHSVQAMIADLVLILQRY